jgi:ParB family transcriptional regulator, chromosome partitioning protein
MFSIHEFREPWELMPTARSLEIVMSDLGEKDNEKLSHLTGLSLPQIERCKKLLEFPTRFQDLSLDPDPKTRIPSNFWIEALPVLNLVQEIIPDLYKKYGRDGITDQFVAKYRAKKIRSVIHFRKIMEAHQFAESGSQKATVVARIRNYVEEIDLETRDAFDEFVVDNKRVRGAIEACDSFISQLSKARLDYVADNQGLIDSLKSVQKYVKGLLEKLKGSDPPRSEEADGDER